MRIVGMVSSVGALLVLVVVIDACATGWCLARLRQINTLCAELTDFVMEQCGASVSDGADDAR